MGIGVLVLTAALSPVTVKGCYTSVTYSNMNVIQVYLFVPLTPV